MTMTSQVTDMTSSSIFFCRCFVSLVKFSYWSKFHVNIITGSVVTTIFFYKGLTRNPKIGNTLVWVLPNIWRLGRYQIWDAKFGRDVSNEIILNAAKCRDYSFYRFWVIKGKPTGEVKLRPSLPTPRLTDQISLSNCLYFFRNWSICIWQLFVNQVMMSWVLKLTLSF